ncbi:mechanosensitive ion channel family protein [Mycobacterium spongiae]|uniref:Mechanosensitive ion channel n=1 Tax=Mycobacterium spongiae TaxID=886343 RepID=A0A975JWN3_9MYCO|nr:mechanosensitive ion channel family protein [Mycobacterium spongiae]QUR66753.1 mechanosensitive ion channel [Mycobacterium spongiae]
MTTSTFILAMATASPTQRWHEFWTGEIGAWILNKGLRIVMLLIVAVLAARFVTWVATQVTQRLDLGFAASDSLVRSEETKHRQAVASVISWVSIVLIYVVVAYEIIDILPVPVGSLVGPAAVLGAALGFGGQRLVQDLLAGFFIIVERQYGFGDLVELSMLGSPENAAGTVEEVTLRVTKLRSSDGEVFTVPNGNIVKSINLSKDWARAVVDIPVPTSADLGQVNEVLHQECELVRDDDVLGKLLLDAPTVMGVESIAVDTVTLRLVAHTLPGKQFEAGRQLRVHVLRALARAGLVAATDAPPKDGALVVRAPASAGSDETRDPERQR